MAHPQNQMTKWQNKLAWSFFDTQTIATGAVAATWFANTAGATAQNSNFPTNGQLPSGQRFVIRAIAFQVMPLNAATPLIVRDVHEVLIGKLTLNLNDQPQWEGHGYICPAGAGLDVAVTANANQVQNGWPLSSNVRPLDPPVYVDGQRIALVAAYNPAVTLATSAIVRCYLHGTLFRDPS